MTAGRTSQPVTAAVVIVTKDRKEELLKAIRSTVNQTVAVEVLVMDDGSTDGTSQAVQENFAQVRLVRSESSIGYIRQRNIAAGLVAARIIFSLDDDAEFQDSRTIESTLREFEHPRVGAVAIPFVDVNRSPTEVRQRAPEPTGVYASYSFIGTAHALRKDLFLALGGYREFLVHQGEEEDYSTRLLNAGYITRCGSADPIHHFASPRRSWQRMDFYGSRNRILYSWLNVPFPFLPGHLTMTSAKTLAYNLEPRRFRTRLCGVIAGYRLALSKSCRRHPVSVEIYRLSRELKRRGAVALAEIEPRLPVALSLYADTVCPSARR
jgi:GT2 family glycosyltransferase